jgi:hypothetical protein
MKWYYFLLLGVLVVACTESRPCAECIYYSDYGAVGNGKADDFDAIIRAHDAANEAGLAVRANAGATYYIGGADKTAQIMTDTDWGDAKFIIDDRNVENRNSSIFNIPSRLPSEQITTVMKLQKNQEKIDLSLQYGSLIVASDNTTMHYMRERTRVGVDIDDGSPQTDVFVVDKNGNVDMQTPIVLDFNNISSMIAYPVDTETLTIKGGHFTTIANQAESRYPYYYRNISIRRSNVVVDGIYHAVTGEGYYGAPYIGFIEVETCTDVLVQNCMLSGRYTYMTIGSDNMEAEIGSYNSVYLNANSVNAIEMGSYDISVNKTTNVTFKNCKQINDIHNTKLWGIINADYSKNLTFDSVEFSNFNAHKGVTNATIKKSVLGWKSVEAIGSGLLLIEDTKICGSNFITLRHDYGSTWNGEIIIRNCEYIPRNGAQSDAVLIDGFYSGQHNFGYTCYMPRKITIDGLVINDGNPTENYQGPKIFAQFNRAYSNEAYKENYPYVITEEVEISNLTIKSGNPLIVSTNPFMFRNVKITEK